MDAAPRHRKLVLWLLHAVAGSRLPLAKEGVRCRARGLTSDVSLGPRHRAGITYGVQLPRAVRDGVVHSVSDYATETRHG